MKARVKRPFLIFERRLTAMPGAASKIRVQHILDPKPGELAMTRVKSQ